MSTRRISRIKYGQHTIDAEDLEFTPHENWNSYELSDGTLLRAKIVANKISRGIDPETGDILRVRESGEPYYNIRYTVVISAEVPENLMRTNPNSNSDSE